MNLAVKAARSQQRPVKRLGNIGRCNGQDGLSLHPAMSEPNRAQDFLKPARLDIRRVHLHQKLVEATGSGTTHQAHHTAAQAHATTTA